jgi:hypothetical protein
MFQEAENEQRTASQQGKQEETGHDAQGKEGREAVQKSGQRFPDTGQRSLIHKDAQATVSLLKAAVAGFEILKVE